jgi:hypothetical protein
MGVAPRLLMLTSCELRQSAAVALAACSLAQLCRVGARATDGAVCAAASFAAETAAALGRRLRFRRSRSTTRARQSAPVAGSRSLNFAPPVPHHTGIELGVGADSDRGTCFGKGKLIRADFQPRVERAVADTRSRFLVTRIRW